MRTALLLATLVIGFGAVPLSVRADPAASPATAPKADASQSKPKPSGERAKTCEHPSGTRLPPKPNECISKPGHSIDHDAIESTGATTAGGALQLLDPTLRTR